MAEYIDREALVAEFKRLELGENSFIERVFADGVYAIIEQFPAADVAPVVRCKDCKYRDGTPGQPNILCAQMHEDDFCSYGERRAEKEPPEEGET
jgi:hypothetical protein